MKNFKKGFTLVEMLIVVVIIGILASALLPRLQGAQAAARDVARVKGISDIISGLESYYAVKGEYPAINAAASAKALTDLIERGYLKDIPADPQKSNPAVAIDGKTGEKGQYSYLRVSKGGAADAGYVLVAKVETWDKANMTSEQLAKYTTAGVGDKKISFENLSTALCDSVDKWTNNDTTDKCKTNSVENLRYVVVR